MFFRRNIGEDFPFDERLREVMDWEWYLRTMSSGVRYGYVPLPLGVYRVHPAQATAADHGSYFHRLSASRLAGEQLAIRKRIYDSRRKSLIGARVLMGDIHYGVLKLHNDGYRRDRDANRLSSFSVNWPLEQATDFVEWEGALTKAWFEAGSPIFR